MRNGIRSAAVIAALSAQVLAIAHHAVVRHRICAHGAEVDVAAAPEAAAAPARAPELAGQDPHAAQADLEPPHCTLALNARTALPNPSYALRPATAVCASPLPAARASGAGCGELLAVAPKTSPPPAVSFVF
jgi:hypothetical protein